MKKVRILLTFDYELPLGTARDYCKGLFEPTERIFALAKEIHVPVILYADVCSAIRFKEWDATNYYQPFCRQLQFALTHGHDTQLHIHPHWMTSRFENGQFVPSGDYSLSGFKDKQGELSIEAIIEKAYTTLVDIGRKARPDYSCIAFRAGGYDVAPEFKRILSKLHALGIQIESSVIKDFYLDYNYSHIDYRSVPSSSSWWISKEGPLTTSADGGLLELPITGRPARVMDILKRRMNKTIQGTTLAGRRYDNAGTGYLAASGRQRFFSKLRSAVNPLTLTFDREYISGRDLVEIVNYQVKKYQSEQNDLVITAIGHPKSMGAYHLALMKEFVGRTRDTLGECVSFVTYPDIATSFQK